MNNIILIGGGGHCRSAIDVIEQDSQFRIVGKLRQHVGQNFWILCSDVVLLVRVERADEHAAAAARLARS